MNDKFNLCITFCKGEEGPYSNDPMDPGGETAWGLSKKAYPHLDMKNLTWEQAKEVYRYDRWNPMRGDELPLPIALLIFEHSVNQSDATGGVKVLQRALGQKPDGIFGPITLAAVRNYPENLYPDLIVKICEARARAYLQLNNAVEERFEKGWIARLLEAQAMALVWHFVLPKEGST